MPIQNRNQFGIRLRQLRQLSVTEEKAKLTQQDLGNLLGYELDSGGYSGATISNWENGKNQINKDERRVLIALLKVFINFRLLQSIDECNSFLQLGNYRPLDDNEINDLSSEKNTPGHQKTIIDSISGEPNTVPQWPHIFPQKPYYHLPSRAKIMDDIVEMLIDPKGKNVVLINGIGGSGKTAFALEVARRLIKLGCAERLVGDSANNQLIVGNDVLPVRPGQYTFFDLWDALAMQVGRNDLIGKNIFFVTKELITQHQGSCYVCLVDKIELMKDYQLIFAADKVNLLNHRLLFTSRLKSAHPSFRTVTLTGLPSEDAIIFLEQEAKSKKKQSYLPLLRKEIDRIMDASGGLPLILQHILELIDHLSLDLILNSIQNGHAPFYKFIHHREWSRLASCCKQFLIKLINTEQDHFNDDYINKIIDHLGTKSSSCLIDLFTHSLLECEEKGRKKIYYMNSATRNFVRLQMN